MNRFYILSILLTISWKLFSQNSFDLVIVGGNPGGIMTAIAAARQGKSSVILERTNYIGGLPANGLGATDRKSTRLNSSHRSQSRMPSSA